METKKNPKVDVRRNSAIYFAVSLALVLLSANYVINYKTYEKGIVDLALLNVDNLDDEEIPITEHLKTPPPQEKPPIVPEKIEEVDDEEEIEETLIDATDSDENTEIVEVDDLDPIVEEAEDIDVPFRFIEDVPIFPGCERGDNEKKRKCMSDKITKHVKRKFNTDLANDLGLTGRQRINVVFKIDKQGNIVGVQSRAPHPRLEREAARVINLLPKMKPGKQRGEAVNVSYALPIIFEVQN